MIENLGLHPLKGVVQHYAWGGSTFIPQLLDIENKDQKPHAEYWIGTHAKGPAQILQDNEWTDLSEITKLPFLLKILDVNAMLSIQSHPNKVQAEIGYLRENKQGIPMVAAHRVFRDDNHKPELMVALSDFWLLHGFRSLESINSWIQKISAFQKAFPDQVEDIKSFYTSIMRMEDDIRDLILSELKEELKNLDTSDKSQPHYWAHRAFEAYGMDKGIFSIYFYNLVQLKEGEAIYQEAGIPHAYLEGQNIEIMANSDNVFRAGLTPKHIDIDLLLEHLSFEEVIPQVILPEASSNAEVRYPSPASEFEIRIITLKDGSQVKTDSFSEECYFTLEGRVKIESEAENFISNKGESFYLSKAKQIQINALSDTRLVRAVTPPNHTEA